MKAERAVVDSNVLISALLVSNSPPRQCLDQLASTGATLLFSDDTFTEVSLRLAKPKFDRYRSQKQLADFLSGLIDISEWVYPNIQISACRDDDDNKFLALAISGDADCIITGDADLLILNPFESIPILAPADYLRGN